MKNPLQGWLKRSPRAAVEVTLSKIGHLDEGSYWMCPLNWDALEEDDREQFESCWAEETLNMFEDGILHPAAVVGNAEPEAADLDALFDVAELFLFTSTESADLWFDATYAMDDPDEGFAEYCSGLKIEGL